MSKHSSLLLEFDPYLAPNSVQVSSNPGYPMDQEFSSLRNSAEHLSISAHYPTEHSSAIDPLLNMDNGLLNEHVSYFTQLGEASQYTMASVEVPKHSSNPSQMQSPLSTAEFNWNRTTTDIGSENGFSSHTEAQRYDRLDIKGVLASPDTSSGENSASTSVGSSGGDAGGTDMEDDATRGKEQKFSFQKFLELWRRPEAASLNIKVKRFIENFLTKRQTSKQQSDAVQTFLANITSDISSCPLWRNSSETELEHALEGVEKVVMNKLYDRVFAHPTTDDTIQDEVLTRRMILFNWIQVEHLDIKPHPFNDFYFKNAQDELHKLNKYKAPRDKLICILNCCKCIMSLLRKLEADTSADVFLPMLIYVVIKAKPARLMSNVQYISRFRANSRLRSEAAYYFTNLIGAVSFIETMDASSLTISTEEFDRHMEEAIIRLHEQEQTGLSQSNEVSTMESNLMETSSAPITNNLLSRSSVHSVDVSTRAPPQSNFNNMGLSSPSTIIPEDRLPSTLANSSATSISASNLTTKSTTSSIASGLLSFGQQLFGGNTKPISNSNSILASSLEDTNTSSGGSATPTSAPSVTTVTNNNDTGLSPGAVDKELIVSFGKPTTSSLPIQVSITPSERELLEDYDLQMAMALSLSIEEQKSCSASIDSNLTS